MDTTDICAILHSKSAELLGSRAVSVPAPCELTFKSFEAVDLDLSSGYPNVVEQLSGQSLLILLAHAFYTAQKSVHSSCYSYVKINQTAYMYYKPEIKQNSRTDK